MHSEATYSRVDKRIWAWGRRLRAGTLAVGAGLLLAAAFPPLSFFLLAPLGIMLFALLLHHTPGVRAQVALAWLAGMGFFLPLLWWVHLFGALPWILLSAIEALALLLVALLARMAGARPGMPRALLLAVAWVSVEWLRGLGTYGFPWGQLGTSLAAAPFLAQGAAWVGVSGLSFGLVFLGAMLAEWTEAPPHWRRQVFTVIGLFALYLVASGMRYRAVLATERAAARESQGLVVAVAQGSPVRFLDPVEDMKYRPREEERELRIYEGLTRRALEQMPYLVVWPESAIPGFAEEDWALQGRLAALAQQGRCWLLAGGKAYQDGNLRNGALLFGPDGAEHGRYDKVHLVPFGEFVPGRGRLPLLDRYPLRPQDITPGQVHRPLDAGGVRVGVLICFESIFPEIAHSYARQGVDLLVVITNDAWFAGTAALRQHAQASALRAIESGCYVARAAYSGISQVIDPAGRVVAELGPGRRGVLVRETYPVGGTGIYRTLGFYLPAGCLLAALTWGAFGIVTRRVAAWVAQDRPERR